MIYRSTCIKSRFLENPGYVITMIILEICDTEKPSPQASLNGLVGARRGLQRRLI